MDASPTTTRCRQCGGAATLHRNPYVGVDLSVHEYYIDCVRCGIVGFVPADREPESRPVRRRGFWARLFAR